MLLSKSFKYQLNFCSKRSTKRINTRQFSTLDFLEKTKKYINDNPVMIFSKSYCPYSSNAKSMFMKMNVNFEALELDQISMFVFKITFDIKLTPLLLGDGAQIQNALYELTRQKTVPNIFIKGQHIGGFSDLKAKKEKGELQKILEESNISFQLD